MSQSHPKTRPTSCLGVGCYTLLMLMATGVLLPAAWWFQGEHLSRFSFWEPEPLPAEEPLVVSGSAQDALRLEAANPPPVIYRGVQFDQAKAVSGYYEAKQGLDLSTQDGGQFNFPAGSVTDDAAITITPIKNLPRRLMPEDLVPLGRGYQIDVGGKTHYDFSKPVQIAFPIEKSLLVEGQEAQVAIFTGREGHWTKAPSQYNAETGMVYAQVAHSSWWFAFQWGVRILTLSGLGSALSYQVSSTVRGSYHTFSGELDETYKTTNFAIHFSRQGKDALHLDSSGPERMRWPLAPQAPVEGVPHMVVLVGEVLERLLPSMNQVGMPIASARLRHDVFIIHMNGEYGLSPPSGPIWITSSWLEGAGFPSELKTNFMGTLAHELSHVAQGQYFGNMTARNNKWWFEMTAPYQAERLWKAQGQPLAVVRVCHMSLDNGSMLTQPMTKDDSELNYTYASFFKWLETKGDPLTVINQVNAGGDPSIGVFDSKVRAAYSMSLGELLHQFAMVYYHDNLWDEQVIPFSAFSGSCARQLSWQSAAPGTFTQVGQRAASGSGFAAINFFAATQIGSMEPLTSKCFPIDLAALPAKRRAKLVIHYPDGTLPESLAASLASSQVGGSLPATGKKGGFSDVHLDEQAPLILNGVGGSGRDDRVTLVVTHTGLSGPVQAGTLQRWVLAAPAFVSGERKGESNDWELSWHTSELENEPKVFKGYNLYRRKLGQSEDAWQLIKENLTESHYTDQAPDKDDYAYTATVVDQLGNESAKAESELSDPFQGRWVGRIKLEQGELHRPVSEYIARRMAEGDVTPQQREWWAKVEQFAATVEAIAKAGIPVTFRIIRHQGQYTYVPMTILFKDVSDEEPPQECERVGTYSLKVANGNDHDPVLFSLVAENRLEAEYEISEDEVTFKFSLAFKRKD